GYVGRDKMRGSAGSERGAQRVFTAAEDRDCRARFGEGLRDRAADPAAAAADQRMTACEMCLHRASPGARRTKTRYFKLKVIGAARRRSMPSPPKPTAHCLTITLSLKYFFRRAWP